MKLEEKEVPNNSVLKCCSCLEDFIFGNINIHECFQKYKTSNYYINQKNMCFPVLVDDDIKAAGTIPEVTLISRLYFSNKPGITNKTISNEPNTEVKCFQSPVQSSENKSNPSAQVTINDLSEKISTESEPMRYQRHLSFVNRLSDILNSLPDDIRAKAEENILNYAYHMQRIYGSNGKKMKD